MLDKLKSVKNWKILKNKKALLVLFVTLFLIVNGSKTKNNHKLVEVYQVKTGDVVKKITASGKTVAENNLIVNSPVSAKIEKINFQSGSAVNKGDEIVILDQKSIVAGTQTAWSTYLGSKAASDSIDEQIESAKRSETSTKFARDVAQRNYTGDDSDSVKQALRTAEASYEAAVSALNVLKVKKQALLQTTGADYSSYLVSLDNLRNSSLKAPESGLLALESVKAGDLVTTGQKLFSIVNLGGIEFDAEVDQTDIESLKPGQTVVLILDGYNSKTFEGKIARIDAQTRDTKNGSTIVDVFIKFEYVDVSPILGMSGSADVETAKLTNVIVVPLEAVIFENTNSYVYGISKDIARKTKVEIGLEGNDFYEIKSGLNVEEKIVTGQTVSELSDGSKITTTKTN